MIGGGKVIKSFKAIEVDESVGPPKSNGAAARTDPNYIEEGVTLGEKEAEYLLPHFTLMVVGRPGAGKTYVIRQMLTEVGYYKGKFDKILLMSPSAQKMGISVPKKQMTQNFDLGWIEDHLWEINKKQKGAVQQMLRDAGIIDRFDVDRLNGKLNDEIITNPKGDPTGVPSNIAQEKERFFSTAIFKGASGIAQMNMQKAVKQGARRLPVGTKREQIEEEKKMGMELVKYVDEAHNTLVKKMTVDMRKSTYFNCLIVLDDMVSQLKANEFNPLLTQLIFNRRHLIINGVISVMIVAQKFTMIPSRIRSNANWLIMFKQNPNDLSSVYKDLVQYYPEQWEQILEMAFGAVEKNRNHLDIWIEKDIFFLNFQRLKLTLQ